MPSKDLKLKFEIEGVLKLHKAYGHKRIAIHLGINRKRVLRVMKLFGLTPIRKPKAPVKKQDVKQQFVNSNLILTTRHFFIKAL